MSNRTRYALLVVAALVLWEGFATPPAQAQTVTRISVEYDPSGTLLIRTPGDQVKVFYLIGGMVRETVEPSELMDGNWSASPLGVNVEPFTPTSHIVTFFTPPDPNTRPALLDLTNPNDPRFARFELSETFTIFNESNGENTATLTGAAILTMDTTGLLGAFQDGARVTIDFENVFFDPNQDGTASFPRPLGTQSRATVTLTANVPEPNTIILCLIGFGGMGAWSIVRRRIAGRSAGA